VPFFLWACAGFLGVLCVRLIENVSVFSRRKDTQTNDLKMKRNLSPAQNFKSKFDTLSDTRCGFDCNALLLLLLLL